MPRPKLTAKQALFVKWYLSAEVAMNGTEAARRAGYKGNDATLKSMGSENIRKPAVAAAIKRGLAKATKRAEVTVEKVLRDLEETREAAMVAEQYGAAVRASELHGRYLKMFTDRIEHVQTVADVSDAELDGLIGELMQKGAIDVHYARPAAGDEPEDSPLPVPTGAPIPYGPG